MFSAKPILDRLDSLDQRLARLEQQVDRLCASFDAQPSRESLAAQSLQLVEQLAQARAEIARLNQAAGPGED